MTCFAYIFHTAVLAKVEDGPALYLAPNLMVFTPSVASRTPRHR